MIKIEKKYNLAIFCLMLFVLITFPFMITHIPHCDESQNYMAAHFMTWDNFFDISASHGHPILWWLVILPFAKFNIAYPYPMLIINYLFTLSALAFMWFKAPFNNVLKIIITFSFMMVSYFAIVARCYSIGILGLFILAYLYKEQTKKPILYSIMLVLTANTSAIACIGVTGLSLLFIYNLFKEKENLKKYKIFVSLAILFVFGYLCASPFFTYNLHIIAEKESFEMFYFPLKYNLTFITAYILAVVFLIYNGLKDKTSEGKQTVFFLLYTIIVQLLFMTFVYCCFQHHNYFFLIYMIMTVWIQNSYKQYEGNLSVYFCVLIALLLFTPNDLSFKHGSQIVWNFGKMIEKENSKYNDSVIMFVDNPDNFLYQVAPFLINNKTLTIMNGNNPYTYSMKFYPPPTAEEIQKNIDAIEGKHVYIFANQYTDLPQYYLESVFDNNIKIYKVK